MTNAEKTEMLTENNQQMAEQNAQAADTVQAEAAAAANAPQEKTAEELALEQGYYACCFRSH